MLNVLTVDTHQPNGFVSKDCQPYPHEDNPMLHAVHCSDQVIARFISDLRAQANMDNTIIALVSDHFALRNTIFDRLKANKQNRRLTWMVWGEGVENGQNLAKATHYDIGPTLMAMMGIPNYHQNNYGHSVLDGRDGLWFQIDGLSREKAKDIDYLNMGGNLAVNGVSIDRENLTIAIDQKILHVSRAGFDMTENTIFMLLLNRRGKVDAVVFAEDMEQFKRIAKDYFVIAVSYNSNILTGTSSSENSPREMSLETPKALYYYMGVPSRNTAESGELPMVKYWSKASMREMLKTVKR